MRQGGRVIIVEDHPLTGEGLSLAARVALAGVSIATADTIAAAEAMLGASNPPRLVILDFVLPDSRGFSGLLRIQHCAGGAPIVVVSAQEDAALVEAARALGAAGFLFKRSPLDDIARDLQRIDEGKTCFPAVPAKSGVPAAAALRKRIQTLSPAQRKVLFALTDGRLNKQIAGDLAISEATVKAHLTAIFRKLGVLNRAQALLAIQPLFGAASDEAPSSG